MTTPKERAAKAIFDDQHKGLLNCLNWDDLDLDRTGNRNFYLNAAAAALAAIAEPSREMLLAGAAAIVSPAGGVTTEITYNMAYACWTAMHAAMMAEKDAGK